MQKPIIFLLIAALLIICLPAVQRGSVALLALHDLVPQFGGKWLPYVSKKIIVEHPQIEIEGEKLETNLYRPGGGKKRTALVCVHGVNELGKDDPRLENLAKTFARAGFVVLVPGLPDMSPGKLNPKVISEIEASIRYISGRADIVRQVKLGIFGFSVGSGPTIIAASRLQNQIPVSFLISFGGYYDIAEVIRYSTTGHFSYQRKDFFIEPDPESRWFFVRYYADFLKNQNDADILRQITQIKISDPGSDVSGLSDRLSPEGKSIFNLLTNADPQRVGELIENLPAELQSFVRGLNPKEQVEQLSANLFIIHSANDNVIPYTQSLELRNYFKGKTHTELFLLNIFSHVNPVLPPFTPGNFFKEYVPETYSFWKLIYEILGYRT